MSPRASSFVATAALVAVATSLAPAPAGACGPDFPNRLLLSPDQVLLSAPVADFARELERLVPEVKAPLSVVIVAYDGDQKTYATEAEDLDRALKDAGVAAEARAAAVERLKKARAAKDEALLEGLEPADIREYARGAIQYARGEVQRAQETWEKLLAMAPAERPRRSVWAAYMLGRSHGTVGGFGCSGDIDPACDVPAAFGYLAKTRELARAGFEDRLGLAATSLGWEAALHLQLGHLEDGYRAFVEQAANGDATGVNSLARIGEDLLKDPAQLRVGAASAVVRPVITALLLSRPSYSYDTSDPTVESAERGQATRWLDTVAAAGAKDVAGADRLGWLAYRVGRFEEAARWLDLAPADGAVTLWTRAKLALRAGKRDEAAALLARVIGAFAEEERWHYWPGDWSAWGAWDVGTQPRGRARGELALLELSGGEYVRALDLLARTDYGLDAAYLAERVVSVDELKALVDAQWPAPATADGVEPVAVPPGYLYEPADVRAGAGAAVWIRYLLGRRLVRAGRLDEAAAYLPTLPAGHEPRYGRLPKDGPAPNSPADLLRRYREALAKGRDRSLPAAERAAGWWEAAKITRHDGMELMGTEVGPDWQVYSGNFSLDSAADERRKLVSAVAPPKPAELRAASRHAPAPDRRFHYRYIAGDYAMNAVKLLPKTSEDAGAMLCHAASWIINRDPPAARRFYREYLARQRHIAFIPNFGQDCPAEP
ncbi:MAG: hypothetical protein EP329_05320 [Deltaproteobacteria bacterium]|nr:MAG: hypothetical protein EP329_05320 [Deltaproteobacteria bacterium]